MKFLPGEKCPLGWMSLIWVEVEAATFQNYRFRFQRKSSASTSTSLSAILSYHVFICSALREKSLRNPDSKSSFRRKQKSKINLILLAICLMYIFFKIAKVATFADGFTSFFSGDVLAWTKMKPWWRRFEVMCLSFSWRLLCCWFMKSKHLSFCWLRLLRWVKNFPNFNLILCTGIRRVRRNF